MIQEFNEFIQAGHIILDICLDILVTIYSFGLLTKLTGFFLGSI